MAEPPEQPRDEPLAERPEQGFDALLEGLEAQVARLADGSAPLDQVVEAHAEAQKLIDEAQRRLRALKGRLEAERGEGG